MPPLASSMMSLGTKAPHFRLPDPQGKFVSSDDFPAAPALLVAFICNHCPFVKHIRSPLAELGKEYQKRGVAIVAISSNDVVAYPDDSPAKMAEESKLAGYTFPYLFDESQDVAKAYGAVCTPDFFLFDRDHRLVYRGRFDETRPNSGQTATGADLRAALEEVVSGRIVSSVQKPSVGCGIKWKPGNAPAA